MTILRIARDLSLPLETVTQTVAILARKRSGKSYTARRIAEQMFAAGLQIACIDPKGDWWGMRSSADGKSPGLGIIILGGEHGDIPLEAGGGEIVAKLVVEERVSVLLDLSLFRKSEVATFVTAFAEALYRLKAREAFRTPVMLFIDEADAVAPQKPQHGEERMLGAVEDIVRRGGQRGIGCTVVTQRSAVLNKNVLTQAQVMVAMRTIAPQDLKAMDAWIDVHGTVEQRAKLMESLPSLPQGDAWFWSPGWPTDGGIFRRVHVERIQTFDSGATPRPGEQRIEPKKRAEVDLEALRRQMIDTVERAKADDPKELRKKISALEGELRKAKVALAAQVITGEMAQRIYEDASRQVRSTFRPLLKRTFDFLSSIQSLSPNLLMSISAELDAAIPLKHPGQFAEKSKLQERQIPLEKPRASERASGFSSSNEAKKDEARLGESGLRRMLIALAQRNGLSARQLGVRAGLSSRSGTFSTYLGRARSSGWIAGGRDRLEITEAGRAVLGPYDPAPEGRDLLNHWLGELGNSGAARMLAILAQRYPNPTTAQELGDATGLSAGSGTFGTYLGKLRTLELVTGARTDLRASEDLF